MICLHKSVSTDLKISRFGNPPLQLLLLLLLLLLIIVNTFFAPINISVAMNNYVFFQK